MRIAIIDLGSNTFNLRIGNSGQIKPLYSDKKAVRLAEDGITRQEISPAAVARAMTCLQLYHQKCREYQVEAVHLVGTSALRDANNRQELEQLVAHTFGWHIRIIDGVTEAELIYRGVAQGFPLGAAPALIMDIGGGSTEFIIASREQVYWKASFNLGSTRLLDQFKPSDPLREKDIDRIQRHLFSQLSPLWKALTERPVQQLIGSSGSFETLADISRLRQGLAPFAESETWGALDKETYAAVSLHLRSSDYTARLHTPGMLAMRAKNIGMACLLIDITLAQLPDAALFLSKFALKEGLWHSLLQNDEPWRKS